MEQNIIEAKKQVALKMLKSKFSISCDWVDKICSLEEIDTLVDLAIESKTTEELEQSPLFLKKLQEKLCDLTEERFGGKSTKEKIKKVKDQIKQIRFYDSLKKVSVLIEQHYTLEELEKHPLMGGGIYTFLEASELAGVSLKTIYNWIEKYKLKPVHIKNKKFLTQDDLNFLLVDNDDLTKTRAQEIYCQFDKHDDQISDLLKELAIQVKANGCVLWIEDKESNHCLMQLGQWFEGYKSCPIRYLPFKNSKTGKVIEYYIPEDNEIDQEVKRNDFISGNILDISEDVDMYKHPFLKNAKIKGMCTVPIIINRKRAAINFYRKNKSFSIMEHKIIKILADLIPKRYQAVRDRASLELQQEIHNTFVNLQSSKIIPDEKDVTEALEKISQEIQEVVGCQEISIFLQLPFEKEQDPPEYKLMATTWDKNEIKNVYKPREEGLTSWILTYKEKVKIPDLIKAKDLFWEKIQEQYRKRVNEKTSSSGGSYIDLINQRKMHTSCVKEPYIDIDWSDSLKLRDEKKVKSLSFLGVPILFGQDQVIGVIRCSSMEEVFADISVYEDQIIERCAAQIAIYYRNWVNRKRKEKEKQQMKDFPKRELYQIFYESLKEPDFGLEEEVLKIAKENIKEAEILAIRHFSEDEKKLIVKAHSGSQWDIDNPKIQKFKNEPCKISEKEHEDYKKGETLIYNPSDEKNPFIKYFNAICVIAAPIKVDDQVTGIVEIAGTKNCYFPRVSIYIVELIADLLGVYYSIKKKETQSESFSYPQDKVSVM